MLKFKLFGLVWDLTLPLQVLVVFIYCMLCLLVFALPEAPWWANLLYILALVIMLSVAPSIDKKLFKEETKDNGTD